MVFKYSILVFNILDFPRIKSFKIWKERNDSVKDYKEKFKTTDKREHRTR